jgi:glycosyltransferase involved in cell wall biosynthesis
MRLVDINGRFLTQAITGVQRVAEQVVQALDHELGANPALRSRYSFRLLTPAAGCRSLALGNIPAAPVGRLSGQLWEQVELPIHSRGRLLLNLCNTAPLAQRGVAVIHDASVFAVPQAYSRAFRAWYRTLIPLLGRRALRVITVSRFSQGELSRRAGIPLSKMTVMPLGAEHILDGPADSGIFARVPVERGRFILAVGSRSPHKNVAAVGAAVSRLGAERLPLVIVGGANPRIFTASADTNGGSFSTGYVSDGELRALYENAMCLVYPSLYEGFGLPPLEAMLCGCPTVVGNTASLPEVCGDAALLCDPRDPDDIAKGISLLIEDPARREELRRRGAVRARGFTWKRAADALVAILDEVDAA